MVVRIRMAVSDFLFGIFVTPRGFVGSRRRESRRPDTSRHLTRWFLPHRRRIFSRVFLCAVAKRWPSHRTPKVPGGNLLAGIEDGSAAKTKARRRQKQRLPPFPTAGKDGAPGNSTAQR